MELSGTTSTEVCDLLRGYSGNLASAASVSWVGLEGEKCGRRWRGGEAEREGECFVVEMASDEEGLEVRGVGVRR